jgi:hypothetical protein
MVNIGDNLTVYDIDEDKVISLCDDSGNVYRLEVDVEVSGGVAEVTFVDNLVTCHIIDHDNIRDEI